MLAARVASAQNYSGTYTLKTNEGVNTMVVQQDLSGKVTGTLTLEDGSQSHLNGVLKDGQVLGIFTTGGKGLLFKLRAQGQQVIFTMIPVTEDNKPDESLAQEYAFTRPGGAGRGAVHGGAQVVPAEAGRFGDEDDAEGIAAGSAGSANPLAGSSAPAADPFVGTFVGNNLRLELEGGRGRYRGRIQFQGQTFPVIAQSAGGRELKGNFTSEGNNFEFTASLQGTTLAFSTGGTTYQLRKQGRDTSAAPTHPLSGGGGKADARGGAVARPIAGSNVVNDPPMGVRFSVPPGWKQQKQQAVYVLGHDTIPGMVLIIPHSSNSIQELRAAASEPLYQGNDGQLMVTGPPETLAPNMMAAEYGGNIQGQEARGRIVGVVSPFGGGFLVLAGADAAAYTPQHARLAEEIARSMTFSKPQLPPEAAMWRQKLTGMRVAYFKHGGSSDLGGSYVWSDKRNIDLCRDGTFQATGGFSGSIGTANASGWAQNNSGQQSGQWRIIGQAGQPALELRHASGQLETFTLSTDGSKTFLNGVRWYVIENPSCP
jgi:hypothetical protein